MTKSWIEYLIKIEQEIKRIELSSDLVFFRGHSESKWNLRPSLFVKQKEKKMSDTLINTIEATLFFDFVTNAGTLLKNGVTDWEILFLMRHHGIPTRVLDWTENFATALYFALSGSGKTPTIWIMDAYELNRIAYSSASIPNPLKDLTFNYTEAYIDKKKTPYIDPIAIIAPRTSERLFAQKGIFVLQGSDTTPMDLNKKVAISFKKFEIPLDAINDAKMFLKLAGTNHYSIFPDLDGLSKHLISIHHLE